VFYLILVVRTTDADCVPCGGIELSDAETAALLNAPDFQRFLENSGKVMQRAMNDSYDYTKDYAMGFGDVE